jgi:threonylcarbamoyladenosine tRNA methylthiotransferase MtaB
LISGVRGRKWVAMLEPADDLLPAAAEAAPEGVGPGRVRLITLGCRLNSYESEVMRAHADSQGLSDAVIINTCAVTAEAVRQARQTIRRARRENPAAMVIVTGCAAQIDPDSFAAMPEVDRVLGNAEKLKAESFAPARLAEPERVRVNDIMSVRETAGHLVDGLEGRARAFVQVQNGCDHRCTFCIIPFGRGNSRSVPAGEVVEQARQLAARGFHELVLTGVDLTSWGADLPGQPNLGNLVARILKLVPELPRLRLSSIDAVEIDDTLFELIVGEPRIAPHLHLSLQAGADLILKRMKRRHLRADALALAARLRAGRPDIALGADFIVGFPTETEAHFADTMGLVEEAGLDYIHVFPFSPRPGTPAAKMPQVPKPLIKARAARLRALAAERLALRLARHVGTEAEVLVERGMGRLADFAPVALPAGLEAAPGSLVRLALTGHDQERLLAAPVGYGAA